MSKAVVLLNMGGVDEQNSVELFLTNMFNDKNIITFKSDIVRKLLAKFIVFVSKKSVQSHYNELGGSSPIFKHTKSLVLALQEKFPDLHVEYCMRYTNPFAKDVVTNLKSKGVSDIFLLPLYPHYSTTTVKSSLEDFLEVAKDFKVTFIERFYENELYTKTIVQKIKEELGQSNANEFHLIYSAHSLPQKIVDNGDTYQEEILAHSQILTDALKNEGIEFKSYTNAYQSKMGMQKWLEPNLSEHLKEYVNQKVMIVPISFTIDNSETDFELSIEYKEVADTLHVRDYRVVKCPNSSPEFVELLANIINTRG